MDDLSYPSPSEVLAAFFRMRGDEADVYEFKAGVHWRDYYTFRITLDSGEVYYWNRNLDIWDQNPKELTFSITWNP